jgi:hypothetical protein
MFSPTNENNKHILYYKPYSPYAPVLSPLPIPIVNKSLLPTVSFPIYPFNKKMDLIEIKAQLPLTNKKY